MGLFTNVFVNLSRGNTRKNILRTSERLTQENNY